MTIRYKNLEIDILAPSSKSGLFKYDLYSEINGVQVTTQGNSDEISGFFVESSRYSLKEMAKQCYLEIQYAWKAYCNHR